MCIECKRDVKDGYRFSCHLLKDWHGGTLCALNVKDQSGDFVFSFHFPSAEEISTFWQHLWQLFDSIEGLTYSGLIEALAESAIKTQEGSVRDDILSILAQLS